MMQLYFSSESLKQCRFIKLQNIEATFQTVLLDKEIHYIKVQNPR
jgi:hypothetical protein